MTKKELIKQVSEVAKTTQKDVANVLEAIILTVGKELAAGNDVAVTGFGAFKSAIQAGRTGKIPGTNKEYTTTDKRVCKFKASAPFAATVAGK